jgi:hypothetical protein
MASARTSRWAELALHAAINMAVVLAVRGHVVVLARKKLGDALE